MCGYRSRVISPFLGYLLGLQCSDGSLSVNTEGMCYAADGASGNQSDGFSSEVSKDGNDCDLALEKGYDDAFTGAGIDVYRRFLSRGVTPAMRDIMVSIGGSGAVRLSEAVAMVLNEDFDEDAWMLVSVMLDDIALRVLDGEEISDDEGVVLVTCLELSRVVRSGKEESDE